MPDGVNAKVIRIVPLLLLKAEVLGECFVFPILMNEVTY